MSLNYVIMFVPNESAMQLAIYEDSSLWQEAFENGVFITSEQNLLALLRMIQLAWAQVKQARNQQEIFDAVNKLIDRVNEFMKRYEELGKKIENLQGSYDDVKKTYQLFINSSCKDILWCFDLFFCRNFCMI